MAFTPDARWESLRKSANIAWIGMEPPSDTPGMVGLGPTTTGWMFVTGSTLLFHSGITATSSPAVSTRESFSSDIPELFVTALPIER